MSAIARCGFGFLLLMLMVKCCLLCWANTLAADNCVVKARRSRKTYSNLDENEDGRRLLFEARPRHVVVLDDVTAFSVRWKEGLPQESRYACL